MPEAQAKIIFDADAAKIIAEALKAQGAVKKVGAEAKGVGKAMEQWGGGLAKSLLGVGALVGMIRGAAAALKEANAVAVAASKTAGGGALDRGMAANRLGITGAQAEVYTTPGRRSRDEQTALLTALSAGGKLDGTSVARATELFGSGVFSQEEIVEGARSGRLDALRGEMGDRLGNLSDGARGELDARSFDNKRADAALQNRAANVGQERQLQGLKDDFRSRNRVAGAALDAIHSATGGIFEAEESAILKSRNRDNLEVIARNTTPRPAVAPAVGKD